MIRQMKLVGVAAVFAVLAVSPAAIAGEHGHGADPVEMSSGVTMVEDSPWLGVMIQDVTEQSAGELGLGEVRGVIVSGVSKGGPAEAAGVKKGDVIVRLNGRDVEGTEDFIDAISGEKVGARVLLVVDKSGSVREIGVVLGKKPAQAFSHGDRFNRFEYGAPNARGAACGKPYSCGEDHERCEAMEKGGCCEGMHGGMRRGYRGHEGIFARGMQMLNLNAEQKKRADLMVSDYRKKTIKAAADIKVAEVELKELLTSDPVNLEKVKAKLNEIAAKKTDLRFFRIKSMEEFKKILTAEQRSKLGEMMQKGHGYGMGMGMTGHEEDGRMMTEGE